MMPEWICAPRGGVKARAQHNGAKTLGPGKAFGVPELVLCIDREEKLFCGRCAVAAGQ